MQNMKKKLTIEGMHCSSCAMSIDMDLEDLPGISSASTSYAKAHCEVEFDPNTVSVDEIINTIKKTGYKAQVQQ
jgi:copper chaperone CopZ